MFFSEDKKLNLSGERFCVKYRLGGNGISSREDAWAAAMGICLEQTVEFPEELVPRGDIRDFIVGKIENLTETVDGGFEVEISYAAETAAGELTQLVNVVFGNSSIKPGIRVEDVSLPNSMLKSLKGPRFGRDGIRKLLGVQDRPMLFTALKPMGLSSEELAGFAYQFAVGGIDLIKDDHGLSNQSFSPFEQRVTLCCEAVRKGNRESGYNSIYMPNITAPHSQILKRAKFAKEAGAGALLISPGLVGLDVIRELAEDATINLPIFSHPAFQGSYVMGDSGVSHAALFGKLSRLAGADATIFPNFGGRFSFSKAECKSIVDSTAQALGDLKKSFPCPAGGMSLSNVPESIEAYGKDVIFLIGGGLFKHGPNLIENCRYFRELVEKQ